MIDHEAIRQLCPDAVTIVSNNENKTWNGVDSQGRPIYQDTPVAYDAAGDRVYYDILEAISISKILACKQQAKRLLSETDWAALPDIGLANADAFRDYRALIRALMITPVEEPTWPEKPTAGWS